MKLSKNITLSITVRRVLDILLSAPDEVFTYTDIIEIIKPTLNTYLFKIDAKLSQLVDLGLAFRRIRYASTSDKDCLKIGGASFESIISLNNNNFDEPAYLDQQDIAVLQKLYNLYQTQSIWRTVADLKKDTDLDGVVIHNSLQKLREIQLAEISYLDDVGQIAYRLSL